MNMTDPALRLEGVTKVYGEGDVAVGDRRYHLCSDLCLERFDAQPERYSA